MPITLEYDANNQVLLGKIEGTLCLDEMKAALQKIVHADEYPSSVDTIWDLSRMAFYNIDYPFAQELVALRRELLHKRGTPRLALVSDYELADGVVEVYRILSKSLPQEMRVFRTINQALNWLAAEKAAV